MPPPFFRHFFSLFAFTLFSASVSQSVSREQIRQSSVRCCPEEFRECCEKRMLRDERIHCEGRLSEQRAMALGICLEKELHGQESVIERRAHKCCWMLSGGEKCQRQCYDNLRAPSIPPTQKFTFTDECPPMSLNGTVPIGEMNCVTDREAVVHSCFPVCLHWWDKNWASTEGQEQHTFDPLRDCPALAELTKSEGCMVPVDLLELALGESETNGTRSRMPRT